jgi:hypothetical protein
MRRYSWQFAPSIHTLKPQKHYQKWSPGLTSQRMLLAINLSSPSYPVIGPKSPIGPHNHKSQTNNSWFKSSVIWRPPESVALPNSIWLTAQIADRLHSYCLYLESHATALTMILAVVCWNNWPIRLKGLLSEKKLVASVYAPVQTVCSVSRGLIHRPSNTQKHYTPT